MAPPLAPAGILFVPQITKDTSQRDRELQRAQALAHAARQSHRNRRERRAEIGPDKLGIGYTSKFKTLPLIAGKPVVQRKKANVGDERSSRRTTLSPLNRVLGQSRLDPFDTGAVSEPPRMVLEVLDFAYDIFWPALFPSKPDVARSHAATRRRLGREHEIVLHAHILVAYSLVLGFHIFRNHPTWLLARSIRRFHEARAVKLIEQEMQATTGPPSDTLLHAALIVSFLPNGPQTPILDDCSSSPLATAQLLNLFGTAEIVPERLRLIYDCVSRKGGLSEIRFQGVRDVLHFEDLIRASRTGTKPVYLDWAWQKEFTEALSGQILDSQALKLSGCLGASFNCIDDPGLGEVLSMACTVTVALDQHHRKAPNSLDMWDLARARNATQWLLCCLEPFSPQESGTHVGLHNVCRLATLIYSDMVLFPIPKSNTVKLRLADELRTALNSYSPPRDQDCGLCSNLLTWALVMGTIAADSTVHRPWYVALLSRQFIARPLSWEDFKSFLSGFLWWEPVLGLPTRNLWHEATARSIVIDESP